ncbi:hypothetical protein QJS10_CPB18g00116 [Acorus calamus]|uniref:Uncharacterized protein n=1 Tax=Acorus calamus TaxID=4465 RepID=A0AAV9CJR4_ACOCL|nr:hypothetical protein QJS10_CPB18g00116 [Acorus calamus]
MATLLGSTVLTPKSSSLSRLLTSHDGRNCKSSSLWCASSSSPPPPWRATSALSSSPPAEASNGALELPVG